MKLRYWLCRDCIKPIVVGQVIKCSFVETPVGVCKSCGKSWEVPSNLYEEANRSLTRKWNEMPKMVQDKFIREMQSAKKYGNGSPEEEWENGKELWVAMLLCEKTIPSKWNPVLNKLGLGIKVKGKK